MHLPINQKNCFRSECKGREVLCLEIPYRPDPPSSYLVMLSWCIEQFYVAVHFMSITSGGNLCVWFSVHSNKVRTVYIPNVVINGVILQDIAAWTYLSVKSSLLVEQFLTSPCRDLLYWTSNWLPMCGNFLETAHVEDVNATVDYNLLFILVHD